MSEKDPFLTRGAIAGVGRYDGVPQEQSPSSLAGRQASSAASKPEPGPVLPGGRIPDPESLKLTPPTRPKASENFAAEGLIAMVIVPWSTFVMVSCAYAFFPTAAGWRAVATTLAGTCFAFSGLLIYVFLSRGRVPIYLHLGVLCALAVVLGWLVGNDIFQREVLQHRLHQTRPTFKDVAPTDAAASFQDAAVVGFSEAARLDLKKVLGHHPQGGGTTYCVAPILSESQTSEVQFWAVGINCCEPLWGFQCDDARKPNARSGLVVSAGELPYDNEMHQHFKQAAKQAAALYSLRTVEEPVFVHWVEAADHDHQDGLQNGVMWVVGMCILHFMVSVAFAGWLHWSSGYRRPLPGKLGSSRPPFRMAESRSN